MSTQDLLIELGTEELPPKSLETLRRAFESNFASALGDERIGHGTIQSFATPRRLALLLREVESRQPDEDIELLGPAVKAAFDAEGNATQAALGFARKCGVDNPASLQRVDTPKGERLGFRQQKPGQATTDLLAELIEKSLAGLPIAKRMRWGAGTAEFVRPVHWVLVRFGDHTPDIEVMGLKATDKTRGHRFHSSGELPVDTPLSYCQTLFDKGHVVADPFERKQLVEQQVKREAEKAGGVAVINPALLEEVSALVEWPVALCGRFDEDFLQVPEEALISSMGEHQKYFHVRDRNGKLMPLFITVSNLDSPHPERVIDGNERVIRPRLADARFFYETDLKTPLESGFEKLENIVFQQQLGSLADKSRRVAALGELIAGACHAEPGQVARAARLAKCDLVSEMVLEFDHLQGTMGRYYAQADGEAADVASAIEEQYLPRHAGDQLPQTATGIALALAERIDTLTGIFGIGQPPTGSRDPFALRRASIGILNILVQRDVQVSLASLIGAAYDNYSNLTVPRDELVQQVRDYMIDRFRALFEESGTPVEVFRAVRQVEQDNPLEISRRVEAVQQFSSTEAAAALAETNKRALNLLSKAGDQVAGEIDPSAFEDPAEQQLMDALSQVQRELDTLMASHQLTGALQALAGLQQPLQAFFESVMVMADNDTLRGNRLALLQQVRQQVMRVADLSELGGRQAGQGA